MIVRRALAVACLAAIVLLRADPLLLSLPFGGPAVRAKVRLWMPDASAPAYPKFLAAVREQTKPGDSIAVIFPQMLWIPGYRYAFYRASYLLAGREVLPVTMPDDISHPENFARARYVAVWRSRIPLDGLTPVWAGHGGVLLRR